jgi:aminopeptidase S
MPLLPRRIALIGKIALFASIMTACAGGPEFAAAPYHAADAPHSAWYADVRGMADASDNGGRREYLRQRLQRAGMAITAQPFVSGSLRGENLIADVGGPTTAPLLMIGAHFDRVDVGRGATDNASGSATALALAERFKRQPLTHHRLKVAFWDLEERGLLGASAYVEQNSERPALYINFDVFGWGDTLWMMSRDDAHPLVVASRSAALAQRMPISAGEQYPPSDHLAFLKAGWPAVSYSLVGGEEIPEILLAFSGKKPTRTPKVMAVIHSKHDTLEQIDDAAVAKGIDTVEAAIREWDAQAR